MISERNEEEENEINPLKLDNAYILQQSAIMILDQDEPRVTTGQEMLTPEDK